MSTSFRKRLLQGELLSGTIISLACPSVAEILSQAGFDWLFVDGEHAFHRHSAACMAAPRSKARR